jgi:hypothetical protein
MSEIKLNIYKADKKNEVEKTYTTEGYDLMLGTVEDFMQIIDVEKMTDNKAITRMVLQGYSQLKPLVKDVFPQLTDDEYKRIKVNELIRMFIQLGTAVVESLDTLKTGN